MITDEQRRQVLSAVADLQTVSTAPSTQQLMDWVAGKAALQRQMTPFHGPAPWYGLHDVLARLQADGLVEIVDGARGRNHHSPPVAVTHHAIDAPSTSPGGAVLVRLTDRGRQRLH